MAEAFVKNIIFPNKVVGEEERFYNGHLLESETYIGGRVECMHNGVYRCDIETDFVLDPKAFEELIAKTPDIAKFFVTHELGKSVEDIVNLESVNASIISKLSKFAFMEKPRIISKPLIYHVDVAAMYPNIILTNRLQPVSIVNEKICSGCVYNNIENNCKRVMEWQWKGEFYPLNRGEFERIKLLHHTDPNLSKLEDNLALRKEVKEYSQKHYKQTYDHKTEMRYDTVCMRENPFYVDTVKAFRDRRYEFKAKVKVWAKTLQKFKDDPDESKKAHNMMLLYESLQLAHKIILNSFYGYVMRKGARWYSMEMAAMVTHTGSEIIQHARNLFVRIGKPLELDTDGIWTLLPAGFPETFDLEFRDGSKSTLSFPCSMCNLLIYDRYKNTQYQMERVDRPKKFTTTTEMSIFFEIDGPHRAMVIPAAREENKVLKKRYAVFDMKGKLSEVKGFEIKRRGELKIIKIFQSEIFSQYLKGATLQECYNYCAETCNKWLGILRQQGQGMRDEEVIDLIAESKVLSKNIKEYDGRKGVAITAAKRMSEFLGADLLEGKGLNCHFVVTKKPTTSPLNERVIPVSIFNIKEDAIKMKFLRKWLKEPKLETHQATLKEIVDWEYYIERLSNTMQKMVTICAAYQGIANPVPFIAHPKWLEQKIARESSNNPQTKLQSFFQVKTKDIEDMDVEKPYISKNPNRRAEFERNEGGKKSARASTKKDEEDFVPTTKLQENFPVWLTEQKKLWRLNRQRRKAGMLPASSHRRDKELGSFFKHSHLQLQNMTLQVLSVTRTKIPGEFNLWIVLENSFTSIKVRVDRTIYINTTNPKLDLGENFKKSSKILPRDKKSLALYECTIPEVHFQKLEKNFELHLTNKTIEGVYETKVDLLFRLATKVGAHTKLAQGVTTREQGTYEIKDLVSFGTAGPSEPIDKSKLHLVYIFIVPFNDERAILFLNERACKITVILFHKRKITDFAHIKKVIQNGLVKSNRRSDYAIDFIQEVNIQSEMEKILSMVIKITEETLSRNFVLCVDGYGVFKSFFESVEENHPIIVLRNTDAGRCYQKASSLDWHIWAINQICEAIQFSEQNLDDRMAISQQLNIPVGCLPEKWEVFSTDLMFSRLLNKHNLIHWASNNGIPDRGMGEVEKESLLNLVETQLNYEEKVKMIFCSNYCIDVPLEDFDLAAVINFEEIVKNDKELSIMMELS
jgi:DNA polymerase epsilon subunit 1